MAQPPSPPLSDQTAAAVPPPADAAITLADRLQAQVRDVGFLRHLWRNFGQVAPGVYRSNHPGARRLRFYKQLGIKAVLNLRGDIDAAPQRIERQACAVLGLAFYSIAMSARRPPKRAALLQLFAHFDTLPRPFLMHCKSGADRAGLASALYLIDQEGADVATAKGALTFRHLHIRRSATGVLDFFLDQYEARVAQGRITLRHWVAEEYDREAMIRAYEVAR